MTDQVNIASVAANLGLPVFPCGRDKAPLVAGGFKAATRDPAVIARMFASPAAVMIGVPTGGASGWVAIDVDVKSGQPGMAWLDANAHRLPSTRTHRTRSGGLHLIFLCPLEVEIRNSAGRVAPGVDVRGEGGFIVVPPSPGYAIADHTPPAEMPEWLIQACLRPEPVAGKPVSEQSQRVTPPSDRYAAAALEGEYKAVAEAREGQRNNQLNVSAVKLGSLVAAGLLDKATVEAELTAAARTAGLDPVETRKTIASGLGFGMQHPRQVPERTAQPLRMMQERRVASAPHDDAPHADEAGRGRGDALPPNIDPETGEVLPPEGHNRPEGETEDDVALAFAASHRGRLAYDHTDKQWFVWADKRWRRDDTGRAFDMAREYVRAVREATDKHSLGKIGFISAVERAARHDRRLAVSHEVWDTDPWLIGVPGGAVDLRTGKTLPADPKLFIARQTIVAPGPEGAVPQQWMAFLDAATRGDLELQAFLQRFAGYCLTGDVSEEVLSFIYGSGGNGKGVFVGTLTAILNEYAVATPIEAFTANSHLNLEYYRAQMAGARLVTASETEAGAAWRESQIKELTGNEAPLSARKPYGSPFTFRPQFKIAIVGNHAPMLRGRSPAMERRLRVVPFIHTPTAPDPYLKDKLRAEYPAILRWMIDGCLMWQRDRLGTTRAIQEATSSYFEAQDGFRRWLEEKCVLATHLRTGTGEAYAAFKAWCQANGEEAPKIQEFTEMVDRHPEMNRVKVRGKATISGLGFVAESSNGRYGTDD